ncbi:MAG: peptidylprolyl isomerase [Nitrospinae bacterium]|nr:peptidylprolyl isomerase [Nitrospinota bacterium]
MQFNKNTSWSFCLVAALALVAAQASYAADSAAAKKGDKVTVEYTGSFPDGAVFDSSKNHEAPLKFQVGSGQVIPGFENAVVGMKKGEEKQITLNPGDAYGDRDPKMTQKVPRADLPKDREPKVGMMLVVGAPDGSQKRATITEVTAQHVVIDLNHPLAGKTLKFKIKLIDIAS